MVGVVEEINNGHKMVHIPLRERTLVVQVIKEAVEVHHRTDRRHVQPREIIMARVEAEAQVLVVVEDILRMQCLQMGVVDR